jgi:hypothetical protein
MSALALSILIFALTPGGIFVGILLRRGLPEHHLSKDSQDVMRFGVGLIARFLMSALCHKQIHAPLQQEAALGIQIPSASCSCITTDTGCT